MASRLVSRTTQTPRGVVDMAVYPFLLAIPAANLARRSGLLKADGTATDPADGALPIIEARWVLPRAAILPAVLAQIERGASENAGAREDGT